MNDTSKEIITLKPQILKLLLEQCLLQESIEVQINKQGQIFNTSIIDQIPIKLKPDMEETDLAEIIKPYEPLSYLKQEICLLLEPLVSEKAEARINEGDRLLIRFFAGHLAFEADIPFARFIKLHDKEVAIQVGFPKELKVINARKYIRVETLIDSKIMLKVRIEGGGDFKARVMELSAGGLSFCMPQDSTEKMPIDSSVNLNISVPGKDDLLLDANVRHFYTMSGCESCPGEAGCDLDINSLKAICGVDFVLADNSQEMLINDLIFMI